MFKKILIFTFWGILAGYMLFSLAVIPNLPDRNTCRGTTFIVSNDEADNLSCEYLAEILGNAGLEPDGKPMDSIACADIENFINGISIVKECQVYKTNDKMLNIEIDCKIPVLYVQEHNGEMYYIDSLGNKITGLHKALHLPVATGHIGEETRLTSLKEIAGAIYHSDFWQAQTEQIHFDENGYITIVPRVGNHIIEFGTAENAVTKLDKLYTFYTKGLNSIGWDKYEKLNIEFNDRVIGTKRNKNK